MSTPPHDLPPGFVPDRPEKHPEHEEAVLLRDAMIAGLAGAASDVAQVGRELYKAAVLTKVQRAVIYSILGLLMVALVGLYVIAVGNKSNGDVIKDCTEAKGVCYQRNQQATGKLIDELITRNEAAAYCSPRSAKPVDYKSCIAGYVKGASAGGG